MAAYSEEPPKKRGPSFSHGRVMDISVLLQMALDKGHISEDIHFKTIREHFEEIVGPLLVQHVFPVKLEKKTLLLKTSNSALQFELMLQKKAIIDKCNLLLDKPFVQAIRFV